MEPIIKSILDSDVYKATMMQVILFYYPQLEVEYEFINRGKTVFPLGFAEELRNQLNAMGKLRLTEKEEFWLRHCPDLKFLRPEFIDYFAKHQFDPSEVGIKENNGAIKIVIRGYWLRTILWEVPILAIISELYYKMTGQKYKETDFQTRLRRKQLKMKDANCKLIDFGTRRRHSLAVHDKLVRSMKENYGANFLGTSNMYLAMKYGIKPIGTYAHEWPMAHQAMFGAIKANFIANEIWYALYGKALAIALPDTFTSDVFFRDFDWTLANRLDGLRQDSGNPVNFGEKTIAHYIRLGIDPMTKKIVFSDNLNDDKAIALQKRFEDEINVVFGIGTNLTNDVGLEPLNMVIKLTRVKVNGTWMPVVKLSDDPGKHTGDPEEVLRVQKELGIAA